VSQDKSPEEFTRKEVSEFDHLVNEREGEQDEDENFYRQFGSSLHPVSDARLAKSSAVAIASVQAALDQIANGVQFENALEHLFELTPAKITREWSIGSMIPSVSPGLAGVSPNQPISRSPAAEPVEAADRARAELLEHAAENASGHAKCRALTAAAELYQRQDNFLHAASLYQAALQADSADIVALSGARENAIRLGEWQKAVTLVIEESALITDPEERAALLALLSDIYFRQLADVNLAQQAALDSLRANPHSWVAALLMIEIHLAANQPEQAAQTAIDLADAWEDRQMKGALLTQAGAWFELAGNPDRARVCYERVIDQNSGNGEAFLEAYLRQARVARCTGDSEGAISALVRLSGLIETGSIQDELLRAAARYALVVCGRPRQAMELVAHDTGVEGLALRARAAEMAGEPVYRRAALEALARSASGSERAVALVELAQWFEAKSESQRALDALSDAAAADNNLETVRLVRERVARSASGALQLARDVQNAGPGDALVAAAKLVKNGRGQTDQERTLLESAVQQEPVSYTAQTLALDAVVAASDQSRIYPLLLGEIERLSGTERIGPLLALLDLAYQGLPEAVYLQAARGAQEILRGSPLVLRQLAFDAINRAEPNYHLAATYWLDEVSACTGWRAAFAATEAGRLLESAGRNPTVAYQRALEAIPGYGPACWALETFVGNTDRELMLLVHQQLAQVSVDSFERGVRLIRAAGIRNEDDVTAAVEMLIKASELQPRDGVIHQQLSRLGEHMPADYLAMLFEKSAEGEPAPSARLALMRAAAIYEGVSESLRAADCYRKVLQLSEKADAFAQWGLEFAEEEAGRYAYRTERILGVIRNAGDEGSRAMALQQLAEVEETAGDAASAVVALESLLQIDPRNVMALRKLERQYLEQGRTEDWLGIVESYAEYLADPAEAAAYLRLAVQPREGNSNAEVLVADSIILRAAGRVFSDIWLIQRLEAAARRTGDQRLIAQVIAQSLSIYRDPIEQASVAVRAAEAIEARSADIANELLTKAVEVAPHHPVAAENLARVRETLGDREGAARAYELAATAANTPDRIRKLWYRAAVIWQDEIGDDARALEALGRLLATDVLYRDTFDRTKAILERAGDRESLRDLLRIKVAAPGEGKELCELNRDLARICLDLGDRNGAKAALRTALTFQPQHPAALRDFCQMLIEEHEWGEASENLIRLTALTKAPDQQSWLFFQLGEIYDRFLPNLERAEIAFSRVIMLQEDHVEAIERLADIYERQNQPAKQVKALQRLLQLNTDYLKRQQVTLNLGDAFERSGEPREAERTYQAWQQQFPHDLEVILAQADFYRRQNATSALAVHLDRAANEYREAIKHGSIDPGYWLGLTEVYTRRGHTVAAQAVAATANALGLTHAKLTELINNKGAPITQARILADPTFDAILAPSGLWEVTRWVLQAAAPALEKVLPLDVKALGAERSKSVERQEENILSVLAEWAGVKEVILYINRSRFCLPLSAEPLAIVIGEELLAQYTSAEKLFLLARAAKIAADNFAVVVRTHPEDLVIAVRALIRYFDHSFEPKGIDLAVLDEIARRVGKAIPHKYHDELEPSVFEMRGMPDFDPNKLPGLVIELGSRSALLATDSIASSLAALLKTTMVNIEMSTPEQYYQTIRSHPEASSLLDFSISDAFFAARQSLRNPESAKSSS
jgi:cellulose synthase operon protein C